MNFFKRCLSAVISAGIALSAGSLTAFAEDEEAEISKGVVILHVGDVHCGIEADLSTLGYRELAAYKARLESEGYATVLVDAGDFSHGGNVGNQTRGEKIVDIMNETGFDIAVPGDSEFGYGYDQLRTLTDMGLFTTISSNFVDYTGARIYDGWTMVDADNMQIAFVGISNPDSMNCSNSASYQNDEGVFQYDLCGGNDGKDLYANVQESVDEAKAAGADCVVAVSHLGNNDTSSPLRTSDVVANTKGINIVIDAHSHTSTASKGLKDKDNATVLYTSSGTKLSNIGAITISGTDGTPGYVRNISSSLISKSGFKLTTDKESDEYAAYTDLTEYIADIKEELGITMSDVVGDSEYNLVINNPQNKGDAYMRYKETNMGDLCADAFKSFFDAEIGIINAGAIHSGINKGEIKNSDISAVYPDKNSVCVIEATGQEILDALEFGASINPKPSENFLQVAGLKYEVHQYIESSVKTDENGKFASVEGEYRVRNVLVNDTPLALDKVYTVASSKNLFKSSTTGFTMFADNSIIQEAASLDEEVLLDYIMSDLAGTIGEEYANQSGDGRIVIENGDNRCGDREVWSFDSENGVLTISGTGDMYDYSKGNQPWAKNKAEIKSVQLIGNPGVHPNAFNGCSNFATLTVSDDEFTLEYIIGDISGNGSVDLQDAIKIAKYLLGTVKFVDYEPIIADYNKNGSPDLQDAIMIAKYILSSKK